MKSAAAERTPLGVEKKPKFCRFLRGVRLQSLLEEGKDNSITRQL
jgi:hypothetical protein